jgi:hypothetical protein
MKVKIKTLVIGVSMIRRTDPEIPRHVPDDESGITVNN